MINYSDGGTAFPDTIWNAGDEIAGQSSGMSLRDYFAAAALQGLMASFAGTDCRFPGPETLARDAYKQADHMLGAREARND